MTLYCPEGTSQPKVSVKDQSANPKTNCSPMLRTLSTSIWLQVFVIRESNTTLPRSSIIHISALHVSVKVSIFSLSPTLVRSKEDCKSSPSEYSKSLACTRISLCKPVALSSISVISLCEITIFTL